MQFMIWATWMLNSLLLMMILLNFLIAILCASFDDVCNKATQYEYKAKADMNVDTMLIQKVMGKLTPFEAVSLTCNCTTERSANPLDKALEVIKANQEETKDKLIKGVQKETQKQIDNVEKKLKMETNSIKVLIKKEVDGENDLLLAQMNEFKANLQNTKNEIVSQINGTKDHLISENTKLGNNVSKGINEVNDDAKTGMSSAKDNVESNLNEV